MKNDLYSKKAYVIDIGFFLALFYLFCYNFFITNIFVCLITIVVIFLENPFVNGVQRE